MVENEPPCGGEFRQLDIESVLELGRQGDVADGSALGADQVMVMLGQCLGELKMGVIVAGHDAANHPCCFKHREIAIHRALGEVGAAIEHIEDPDRLAGLAQHVDELTAGAREPMSCGLQAGGHHGIEIGGHRPKGSKEGCTGGVWKTPAVNRWLKRTDVPRGADYDARWTALAAAGANVHGEVDFLMACLAPGRVARVLDAGCGTGRVALELARRGVEVVGVDLDPAMLAEARTKNPEGRWVQGDLATLALVEHHEPNGFDLVAMAGNVMIFLTPGTEGEVLARLAVHLVAEGLLVAGFELGTGRLSIERYDELALAAGFSLVDRYATWDRVPFVTGGSYAVSVHRLGATPALPGGPRRVPVG